MTVSHVYRALKRDGLIIVRPGKGTDVAGAHGAHPGKGKAVVHRLVDVLVTHALKSGSRPAAISHMVTARLAGGQAHRPLIALVSLFSHATEVYAREAVALLADLAPEIVPYMIGGLRASAAERERTRRSDMVLTTTNRVRAVQSLLGSDASCAQGLVFVAYLHTLEPSSMEVVRPLIERLSGLWPHANGHRRCT